MAEVPSVATELVPYASVVSRAEVVSAFAEVYALVVAYDSAVVEAAISVVEIALSLIDTLGDSRLNQGAALPNAGRIARSTAAD